MGETNCCLQHFDMASKVILVTGGNKGIGLAIVETLLKQLPEALVLLGSRDAGRGEDAVACVKAKLGPGVEGRVKLLLLDVTSQESVDQRLCHSVWENTPRDGHAHCRDGCPVPCVPHDWRPRLPARLHQRLVLWVGLSSQPPSQVQKSWHGCLWRRIPLKPITG